MFSCKSCKIFESTFFIEYIGGCFCNELTIKIYAGDKSQH